MNKIEALSLFLECSVNDVIEQSETEFDYGVHSYLVLTDEEADEMAGEQILNSVWAFNPSFLACHTGLDEEVIESIQGNDKYEDNNPVILKLIDDKDHFVTDAINVDGRGHFIAGYDLEENEQSGFYIYRTN